MSDIKIAIVGNKETVNPFRAFGFSAFYTKEGEEKDVFLEALKHEWAIVFVTEDVFSCCQDLIEKTKMKSEPIITIIPDTKGSQHLALKELRKATIAAISTDIL